LLASPAFRSSRRGARFLEFTVGEALQGRADTLKERTLAVEVFDRSPSWDAGDDTIVRVGAREVRKRLAQFYSLPEAANEKIRIELPLGSYVPEFVRCDHDIPPTRAPAVLAAPLPPPAIPAKRSILPKALVALLLISALGFAGWRVFDAASPRPFDVFWGPFFHSSEPILVAIAHPMVYSPSAHAYALRSLRQPPNSLDLPSYASLQVPPSALNGSDFIPQPDKFLAFGDAAAQTAIQVLLAKHDRETRSRFASLVQFADLRDAPTVFVGAFSNRWTMQLIRNFRYHFGYDQHWTPTLLDFRNPQQPRSMAESSDDNRAEDYFLICRLPNSVTGTLMVIGAGVSDFGTEASGRFLSSTKLMNKVLRGLPADWPSRNLQLVLRARVIGDSPAAPEMVASYLW
jgi:hypothetical protein